jgi:tetratricopeptide (TPR) repeat protein
LSVYILQLLMGVCIIALVNLIGRRVYGERAGLISALLCLVYAPFTALETKILTTVTEMLLGLLYMYLLVRAEQEGRRSDWVAGATVLGFAILCRPNYILVVPLTIMVLLLRHRKDLQQAIWPAAAVALIPGIIVGAVALRNYVVAKDFVLISSSAGVTFAQGNNPMARGAMVVLPGFSGSPMHQRQEETQIAEKAAGRVLKPSEVSAFWFRWALGFIQEHPLDYLRLLLDKVLLIFNNRELGGNYLMEIEKSLTPCLKLAFLPFGFIMAWAVAGLLPILRTGPPASVLIATFFGTVLMLILFYVSTRFRMTVAPAAIILAGGGVATLLGSLKNVKRTSLTLLMVAALFVLSFPPFLPLSKPQLSRGDGEYWINLAVVFEKNGELEKSLWAYDEAIRTNPERYRSYLKKAELLKALQVDASEVVSWAQSISERFPREYSAHMLLADTYRAAGRNEEAIQSYQQVIALNPEGAEAYLRLGKLLGQRGDHQQAKAVLANGMKARPRDVRLEYDYAVQCRLLGERAEALKWLKQIVSKNPAHAESRRLLQELEKEQ